jgi:hypothetical protein
MISTKPTTPPGPCPQRRRPEKAPTRRTINKMRRMVESMVAPPKNVRITHKASGAFRHADARGRTRRCARVRGPAFAPAASPATRNTARLGAASPLSQQSGQEYLDVIAREPNAVCRPFARAAKAARQLAFEQDAQKRVLFGKHDGLALSVRQPSHMGYSPEHSLSRYIRTS